ncbi:MAG: aspartate 1-decarboxylase [Armatimonadota bacterium]
MFLTLCKSKIHRATVTEANLNYVGSITIAEDLMEAAGFLPYERVQVLNLNSGARLETYVITGARGSGVMCLNGPAAHHFTPGDMIIVIAYAVMTPEEARDWHPTVVFVDEQNTITRISCDELPLSVDNQ